jgi:hypothetical protein
MQARASSRNSKSCSNSFFNRSASIPNRIYIIQSRAKQR